MELTLFHKETGEIAACVSAPGLEDICHYFTDNPDLDAVFGTYPGDQYQIDLATKRPTPRVPSPEESRAQVWTMVKKQRLKAERSGTATPFGMVQTDERSMMRLEMLASRLVNAGEEFTVAWTMADNGTVLLSRDDARSMLDAVFDHIDACHAHAQDLRILIEASADTAALAAIDIRAGWPSPAS